VYGRSISPSVTPNSLLDEMYGIEPESEVRGDSEGLKESLVQRYTQIKDGLDVMRTVISTFKKNL
jgi:hypothetical protein